MKHASNESISALVDDELGAFETRRLLTELTRDAALREQWHGLHAVSGAVRDGIPIVPIAFADRVAAAIAAEPKPASEGSEDKGRAFDASSAASASRARSWMRPIAGSGVAAAVALVTIGIWGVGGDAPVPGLASPTIEAAGVTAEPATAGSRTEVASVQGAQFQFLDGRFQEGSLQDGLRGPAGSFSLTGGPSSGLVNPWLTGPVFPVSASPFVGDAPAVPSDASQIEPVGRDRVQ